MLRLLFLSFLTYFSIARQCTKDDYIFEYTECKPDGSRWRVSVPKEEGACSEGEGPAPPIKGQPCDFTCGPGTYLQREGDQECHSCPAGEFSLGGGVRYSQWDSIPKEFTQKTAKTLEFSPSDRLNCNGTTWAPRGSYLEAIGRDCSAQLVLNVELIKNGKLTVVYQYPYSASTFKIIVSNDQCVSGLDGLSSFLNEFDGGSSNVKYLDETKAAEWKTEEVSLSSGKNQITFEVSFFGMLYEGDADDKMAKIKSIEIDGIAYSSSCTLCPPGTYSNTEGASICEICPKDTYASKVRSTKCLPCNKTTHYSSPGSANCTWRKPCTKQDYFVTHTPCDESGQTRMMYEWVEPRVCRYDIEGSVNLPKSGTPTFCPPCNPGMTSFNVSDGKCVYCPKGYHGDGKGECKKCPTGTEPMYNIELKYFHSLPSNVQLSCFSGSYIYSCSGINGWVMHGDYIGTEPENDVNSGAKMKIWTLGFRGLEGVTGGKPNTVGRIQFTFEVICSADCQFTFLEAYQIGAPTTVSSWKGTHQLQSFTYDVTHSGKTEFIFYFQKSVSHYGWHGETGESEGSGSLPTGELRIYSINITNTIGGGATYCGDCLTRNSEEKEDTGCIGCPAGHYFDPTSKNCFKCPANTYANVLNPIGEENCLQCGPGTRSVPGSTYCFSDCTFTDSAGRRYNFSALSEMTVNVLSSSLFTASGSRYYHRYTLGICGSQEKRAQCNATLGLSSRLSSFEESNVQAFACKLTAMPHMNGTKLYADPVSLGDQLLAVVDEESIGNLTRKDFVQPDEGNGTVITFFFRGSRATFACPSGRSSVVSLHCNPDEKGLGKVTLPNNCPDGTCDGCVYGFIWHTQLACPYCREDDYEQFKVCGPKDNQTHVYYRRKESSVCYGGVKMPSSRTLGKCSERVVIINKGSIMDYKVYIAIGLGIFALLVIILFVLWYKNRSLKYKYQKLIQSSNPGDELPAPETCGQESDEEVVFDQKQPTGRGKKLLKKIKGLAGKKNQDEEYFDAIKLEPMASST